MKILFIHCTNFDEVFWRDGLWAALGILKKTHHIDIENLHGRDFAKGPFTYYADYDFILGWGGFESPVELRMQILADLRQRHHHAYKLGLLIGGTIFPPVEPDSFDVLFYETEWHRQQINLKHPPLVHAFGVNTDIFHPANPPLPKIWDYLTVGAFSLWKRHKYLLNKTGVRMAVGQLQEDNLEEAAGIFSTLTLGRVGICPNVTPEKLAYLYQLTNCVYVPAELHGGGERTVLEARACGVPVEVEPDNYKLQELLTSPIWDQHYYAAQLEKGMQQCLNG